MLELRSVFVTGATGYIAKHIILQLLEAGYKVRGSVRNLARGREVRSAISAHIEPGFDLDSQLSFVALDLSSDKGWDDAMVGIDVLLHTASPLPIAQPKDENELIKPAVEGTLRALRAAKNAGISRVVMTSSVAAIMYQDGPDGRDKMDERDWSDLSHKTATPYVKSKTLAERAAWDYVNGEGAGLELTAINPGVVLGPPLDDHIGASLSIIQMSLQRAYPAVPAIGFVCVDVRDVARMHVAAIERTHCVGNRYIAVDRFIWLRELVGIMAREFPESGIATRKAPSWLVRLLALFKRNLGFVVKSLDKKNEVENGAARHDLDIEFIDIEKSIIDSTRHLIDHKLV